MSDQKPEATPEQKHDHPAEGGAAAPAKGAAIKALLEKLKSGLKSKKPDMASVKQSVASLKSAPKALAEIPVLFFKGDLQTKFIVLGFFVGLAMIGYSTSKLYHRIKGPPKPVVAHKSHEELEAEKAKELKIASERVVFLEHYTVHLASKSGNVRVLEIEVVGEAENPETATWIKSALPQIKDIISSTLQRQKFDSMITDEGKDQLKALLLKNLNVFTHKNHAPGQIKRVFFTQFIMGN